MKIIVPFAFLVSMLSSCALFSNTKGADNYPDIWWQEVPKDQLASWEISPHTANRQNKEVILSKRNELGQLSNFTYAPFELDGVSYASIEGLWQALKFPEGPNDERLKDPSIKWEFTREQVQQLSSFEAKHAGEIASANMKKLGINWISYKGEKIEYKGSGQQRHYEIILSASRAKLAAHPEIMSILMRTKGLKFFADHRVRADDPPAYRYYDIYMKLRDEVP